MLLFGRSCFEQVLVSVTYFFFFISSTYRFLTLALLSGAKVLLIPIRYVERGIVRINLNYLKTIISQTLVFLLIFLYRHFIQQFHTFARKCITLVRTIGNGCNFTAISINQFMNRLKKLYLIFVFYIFLLSSIYFILVTFFFISCIVLCYLNY